MQCIELALFNAFILKRGILFREGGLAAISNTSVDYIEAG